MAREYYDAISRYTTDRTVPDFDLDKTLGYLLRSLATKHYDGIATFSGAMVWNHKSFCERHKHIDFEALSRIDTFFNSKNSFPYLMMKDFVEKALEDHGTIQQELSNVAQFVRNVRIDPFYTPSKSLTNHLAASIEFISDYDRLWKLSAVFDDAELPYLESIWGSGVAVQRIHVLVTIARIGEAIHSLSSRIKHHFFSEDFIKKLKEQRNILFHPEKEGQLEHIQEAIAGTFDLQYFFDYRDELIRGYALARIVYNDVMSRREYADEVSEIERVLESISEEELNQKFTKVFPEVVAEYTQRGSVSIDSIWASVTIGISAVEVVPDLSTLLDLEKRMLSEVNQIIQSSQCEECSYFSELEQYFDSRRVGHALSGNKDFESARKRFLKFQYSHAFNRGLHTSQEVDETLRILDESFITSAKKVKDDPEMLPTPDEIAKSNKGYNTLLDFDAVTRGELLKWRYHTTMHLFLALRENLSKLRKSEKSLEKYNDHYDAAMYAMNFAPEYYLAESELKDTPTIIQEYRHFEEKHHKLLEERRDLFNRILAVDRMFSDVRRWIQIRDVTPVLSKVVMFMGYCVESVENSHVGGDVQSLHLAMLSDSYRYSAMDFYVTLTGSMIRNSMGLDASNIPLIEELKKYTFKSGAEEIDGYTALSTIQRWRGKIAHNHVMTAGIPNQLEFLVLSCIPHIESCKPIVLRVINDFTAVLQNQPYALPVAELNTRRAIGAEQQVEVTRLLEAAEVSIRGAIGDEQQSEAVQLQIGAEELNTRATRQAVKGVVEGVMVETLVTTALKNKAFPYIGTMFSIPDDYMKYANYTAPLLSKALTKIMPSGFVGPVALHTVHHGAPGVVGIAMMVGTALGTKFLSKSYPMLEMPLKVGLYAYSFYSHDAKAKSFNDVLYDIYEANSDPIAVSSLTFAVLPASMSVLPAIAISGCVAIAVDYASTAYEKGTMETFPSSLESAFDYISTELVGRSDIETTTADS